MSEFNFDGRNYDPETTMTINDLHCIFNMPKALKSQIHEGKEVSQALPPYSPRKAFKVDEYNCPDSWMHGSSLASSYFVPVESERGMWLDFNRNCGHKHHVAILISVQGVNPLDGQSMVEGSLHLSQYKTKCPKHDIEFGADRFCEKCGYKWVPQNYLATTGTPNGLLWLDGFLAADGVVRQYYFTEEEAKGVAHQVIGVDKKVYSIGIAFYLSKEPKPIPQYVTRGGDWGGNSKLLGYDNTYYGATSSGIYIPCNSNPCGAVSWNASNLENQTLKGAVARSRRSLKKSRAGGQSVKALGLQAFDDAAALERISSDEYDSEESVKQLDIAAGAKIDQKVYEDPNGLDFWQDAPAGMLYVNYCPAEQVMSIIKQGKKDLTAGGEGFLAGLKAGR